LLAFSLTHFSRGFYNGGRASVPGLYGWMTRKQILVIVLRCFEGVLAIE